MSDTPPSTMMDAFGAQRGDASSWNRLDERLRPWLKKMLPPDRLPPGFTADDIVSITFADVFRDIASFDVGPGSDFRKWVVTIMRNRVRDLWRRNKGKGDTVPIDHGDDGSLGGGVKVADDAAPRASMIARCAELRSDFQSALADLDAEKRAIIELRVLHGLTFEEIATKVGRHKEMTVKTIYHRAMEKLKQRLRRHDV